MRWTNATAPLSLMKDKIVLPDFVLTNYSTYIKHEVLLYQLFPFLFSDL